MGVFGCGLVELVESSVVFLTLGLDKVEELGRREYLNIAVGAGVLRTSSEFLLFGVVVPVLDGMVGAGAVDDSEVRKGLALNGGLICRAARAGS